MSGQQDLALFVIIIKKDTEKTGCYSEAAKEKSI